MLLSPPWFKKFSTHRYKKYLGFLSKCANFQIINAYSMKQPDRKCVHWALAQFSIQFEYNLKTVPIPSECTLDYFEATKMTLQSNFNYVWRIRDIGECSL